MRVLAATDKFRGTATAADAAAAVCRAIERAGGTATAVPLADGGEGTLDVLGGGNRRTTVMGPLGDPVDAPWRLNGGTAIVEMARASGLVLVGGAEGNDPIAATSHGTGELIATALDAGAKRILVGMGGSATTDGGLGAMRAIWTPGRLRGAELVAACDVRTRFVDAAEVFAPQKGAVGGPGAAPEAAPRTPGPGLHRRLRSRRPRPRGVRRRRRPGRRASRARRHE